MARFIQRYFEYRHVGHSRLSAWRFAWLVGGNRRALPIN
jgi:hypothetical protein